jgi:hypothetical protein
MFVVKEQVLYLIWGIRRYHIYNMKESDKPEHRCFEEHEQAIYYYTDCLPVLF